MGTLGAILFTVEEKNMIGSSYFDSNYVSVVVVSSFASVILSILAGVYDFFLPPLFGILKVTGDHAPHFLNV